VVKSNAMNYPPQRLSDVEQLGVQGGRVEPAQAYL